MATKLSKGAATVKAVRDFFEKGTNGRKCSVQELKLLTDKDRLEIRELVGQISS
jgi:hypothetical protein